MRNTANMISLLLGLAALSSHTHAAGAALTDPTRPYNTGWYAQQKSAPGNTYNLHSTLVSSDRRVAVINGSHVSEGETIGNATVIRIGKHNVTLQSPNRQITLELLPNIVKKQP